MAPLRLALLGYGRMGSEVERVALERGHTIALRVRSTAPASLEQLRDASVAVDFSSAESVASHIALCKQAGLPLVIGTTGWSLPEDQLHAAAEHIAILVGANFSIGVAITRQLAAQLGQMLGSGLGYHLHVHEMHHRFKRDHPSGTALLLARTLQQNLPYAARIVTDLGALDSDTISLSSSRVGTIVGTHTIVADSEADTIEIIHRAKSRRGFALGAVLAAEWIVGRRGTYRFEDVAFEIIASATSQQ